MPARGATVVAMGRTVHDAAASLAIDVCPVCTSSSVRIADDWFMLELDRSDDLRGPDADLPPEFACRECGASWS
jgi:hypothetical protein